MSENNLLNINLEHFDNGNYSEIDLYEPLLFKCDTNYIKQPLTLESTICKIKITQKSIIDIIEYENSVSNNNILCSTIIHPKFNGSNTELIINPFIIRTSFLIVNSNDCDLFPITPSKCIYNKELHIIRDVNNNLLPLNKIITFSNISFSPVFHTTKLDSLNKFDYIDILAYFECIFQTAICNNYSTLILSIIPDEYNYPLPDILNIINYCIVNYLHLIKYIIISVNSSIYYDEYRTNIIDPQNIIPITDQYEKKNAIVNNKLKKKNK